MGFQAHNLLIRTWATCLTPYKVEVGKLNYIQRVMDKVIAISKQEEKGGGEEVRDVSFGHPKAS